MRPAPSFRVRGVFLALVSTVLAGVASGHDLWVLPGAFRLAPGETSRVFLNNGDVFPESLTLTGSHRLEEVGLFGPRGSKTLVSEFRVEDKSLTFDLTPAEPGALVIGVTLRPRRVRVTARDFEDYLSLERLASMSALRESLGEAGEATVERYSKWAKTFVEVAAPDEAASADELWREPIGQRLEIVPLRAPTRLSRGDAFGLRVLFEGEPLSGVPIVGGPTGAARPEVEVLTGEDGIASVAVTRPGRWYVRALHMERREDDPEVKWESFWCTLTFEVKP